MRDHSMILDVIFFLYISEEISVIFSLKTNLLVCTQYIRDSTLTTSKLLLISNVFSIFFNLKFS